MGRTKIERRSLFGLVAAGALVGAEVLHASPRQEQGDCAQSHIKWVADAMMRMQTIKTGMARKQLLRVFKTEGGISTPLQRIYVSRDCPYFKVNVEFRAEGRPERGEDGRLWMIEGDDDVITKMSEPYLQFSIMD